MVDEVLGEDVFLNIDQVSRMTGVRKSTLRYWEKSFEEFLKPMRTASNRREYSLADIEVIQRIKRLIEEEHLTNMGVRIKLKAISESNKKNSVKNVIKGLDSPGRLVRRGDTSARIFYWRWLIFAGAANNHHQKKRERWRWSAAWTEDK